MKLWKHLLLSLSCLTFGTVAAPLVWAQPAATATATATDAATVKTGSVSIEMKDRTITVSGKLISVKPSTKDNVPWMLKIDDASGPLDMVFWKQTADALPLKPQQGEHWQTSGRVSEFKTGVQLRAEDATAWKKQEPAPGEPAADTTATGDVTPTGKVTSALVKQTVTVQGTMQGLKVPGIETAPYNMPVDDGSGEVNVVFWKTTVDALSAAQKTEPGDLVRVTGTVDEYRGAIQLKVETPAQIKTAKTDPELVKAPAQAEVAEKAKEAPAPATVALKDLTNAKVGEKITVKVVVKSAERLRLGQRLLVADATGTDETATLFVWDNALGLLPDATRLKSHNITSGATVEAVVVVDTLEGKPCLYVNKSKDLKAVIY